jgi:hypothetical protein
MMRDDTNDPQHLGFETGARCIAMLQMLEQMRVKRGKRGLLQWLPDFTVARNVTSVDRSSPDFDDS